MGLVGVGGDCRVVSLIMTSHLGGLCPRVSISSRFPGEARGIVGSGCLHYLVNRICCVVMPCPLGLVRIGEVAP